jgi:hypothetical protein
MNQALFPASATFAIPSHRRAGSSGSRDLPWTYLWTRHEEVTRLRRLRSLLGLFALYAAALIALVVLSDGADIGCVLGGIAGHVLYATARVVSSWRDAAGLEDAKTRTIARLSLRLRPTG